MTWPLITLNRIVQDQSSPHLCEFEGCSQWAEFVISSPAVAVSQHAEVYMPTSCGRHLGALVAKVIHLAVEEVARLEREIPLHVVRVTE